MTKLTPSADAPSPDQEQTASAPQIESTYVPVHIAFVEIGNFRRLKAVRLEIDLQTTVVVGANNSGKTAALSAMHSFLGAGRPFSAYDISAASWKSLLELSETWDQLALPSAGSPAGSGEPERHDEWQTELDALNAVMPFLDLWIRAQPGDFHRVSHLIPNLAWDGGLVGVRLRLEPASDLKTLQSLAFAYREARSIVVDGVESSTSDHSNTWPTDIVDYWKRHPKRLGNVAAYKLDPGRLTSVSVLHEAQPQKLAATLRPLSADPLKGLVRVDFIPAQRGLGAEEAEGGGESDDLRTGLFSRQINRFTKSFLESSQDIQQQRGLLLALAESQKRIDGALNSFLAHPLNKVKKLGYPGLNDPQDLVLRSRVRPERLLDHSAAVQYRLADDGIRLPHLPEHAIGLGYQNLLSLSFRLLAFESARSQPDITSHNTPHTSPIPIHLVLLEEPEAHLHVQVQRTFLQKAYGLISPEQAGLSSQLIISTHSSHMAHALPFRHLRFIRRMAAEAPSMLPTSVVVGLDDVFGQDDNTRRFVERYLRVQHSDLFFADAAIFIEGTAERLLVPTFIEREFPTLTERYLSILEVGGSHAHRLKPLVERLGLTTLVITDLDPTDVQQDAPMKARRSRRKVPVGPSPTQVTSNPTLKDWIPKESSVQKLLTLPASKLECLLGKWQDAKVRVAYQIPGASTTVCATSFEDALLLENRQWFRDLGDAGATAIAPMQSLATSDADDQGLAAQAMEVLATEIDKGAFALDLLDKIREKEEVAAGTAATTPPFRCPRYISDGLSWLLQRLEAQKVGGDA